MISALLVLVLPSTVPNVVSLSAVLEENGAPVSRSVQASFILWDAPSDGNAVWLDGARALPVDDGVLVAELGTGAPLPPTLFSEPLWLEIVIDGQTLAPRARIASAPYALAAAHADSADSADLAHSLDGLARVDVATRADLATPGALPVSAANIVDAHPGVPIYATAAGCHPRALTTDAQCSTSFASGGSAFLDCAGFPTAGASLTCANTLLGLLTAPPDPP